MAGTTTTCNILSLSQRIHHGDRDSSRTLEGLIHRLLTTVEARNLDLDPVPTPESGDLHKCDTPGLGAVEPVNQDIRISKQI